MLNHIWIDTLFFNFYFPLTFFILFKNIIDLSEIINTNKIKLYVYLRFKKNRKYFSIIYGGKV